MILNRLYELAVRDKLLDDTAFESQPVPYVIALDKEGKFLGVSVRRERSVIPGKSKSGASKEKLDGGIPQLIPRAHGNAASQGFARFLVDTVPRVVPLTADVEKLAVSVRNVELAKRSRSRETFWRQVAAAADDTNDDALRAVQAFGKALAADSELAARVEAELLLKNAVATDRCTFAYNEDYDPSIIYRESVRTWFRAFYAAYTDSKQQAGPTGLCQITRTFGPMPTTHPIKLSVPGWMSMGVSVVSYDKAAFESHGLEGTANASIGYAAADGYGLALRALIGNALPGRGQSSLRIGDVLFLYWTRDPTPIDEMNQIAMPQHQDVESLIGRPAAGKDKGITTVDPNQFYCLAMSSNSARAVIRDYLETPLDEFRANIVAWFRDLRIASTAKDYLGASTAAFPLWQLVGAMTAKKPDGKVEWDRVNDLSTRLMAAALKHEPLPDFTLAACLQRLRAEGEDGFQPPRMALIKLFLVRKGVVMSDVSEKANPLETNPAYVCGELLFLFNEIQYAALKGVNSNVVDKWYGGFSTAPATALSVLFANAENHLRSIRGVSSGRAAALGNRLAVVSRKLKDIPQGQLSMLEQARFALGYYHAKADRIERQRRREQEKADKAEREQAAKAASKNRA